LTLPAAELFFLPASDAGRAGQRLCVYHAPAVAPARGAIVYFHPWAEEMNKARRMAALQSRALAAAGYAVLQIDLHGCGDSSGDFGDATWDGWLSDVTQAVQWLQTRHAAPLWLWGLRAGALLATHAAARMATPCNFLFWQAAISGKVLLQQFMRLKAAAQLQKSDATAGAKGAMEQLRADMVAGRTIEIAGYMVNSVLALGLEQAVLNLPPSAGRVVWLETSTRDEPELLPASLAKVQAWRDAGTSAHAQAVTGPAFWQTQEIEDAPALIQATVTALAVGA
jgi:uncharacterized protein